MKKLTLIFSMLILAVLMSVPCFAITLNPEASITTDGERVYYIEKNAAGNDILCSCSLDGRERREIFYANNLDIRGMAGHYIWLYAFDNKDLSMGHDANVVVVDVSTGLDSTVARNNYITCFEDAVYLYPWGKEPYNSLYYCSIDGSDISLVTDCNQKTFTLLGDKLYYMESDGAKCRVMCSDKDGGNPVQYYDWFSANSIYQLTDKYVQYGDAANNIYQKYFADDSLKYVSEGSYANFCYEDDGNLYYHDYSKFFVLTKSGETIFLDNLDQIANATILRIINNKVYYMTGYKIEVESMEVLTAEQLEAANKPVESTSSGGVSVYLDGEKLTFTQDPIIVNGTTLVPMRSIFEAMGATVNWDADSKTIYANCGGTMLELGIGKYYAVVGGQTVSVLTPAQIVNGNTMVPVRVIAQSFGIEPGWDEATKSVIINR